MGSLGAVVQWLDEPQARAAAGKKWLGAPDGTIPAWVAEMDVAPPREVTEALLDAVRRHATMYPALERDTDLPDHLADWHRRRLAQTIDPRQVLFLGDVVAGIDFTVRTLLSPGDRVVVPTPSYPPFGIALQHADRPMVGVPLDTSGRRPVLDLDAIDAALTAGARAILLCNPHNPTGYAPTARELADLGDVAVAHRALVVADEVHAPLALPESTTTTFSEAAPNAAELTVTITSTSKAYNLAGLRFAWLATHHSDTARRLGDVPFYVRAGWTGPGLAAARAAVTEGDAWLDALRTDLAERHRRVGGVLGPLLAPGAISPPEASYLAWLDTMGTPVEDAPARHFAAAGVRVSPGTDYGGSPSTFRLNVALSDPLLELALDRLASSLS